MKGFTLQWQSVLALALAIAARFAGPWSLPEAQALADPTASIDYPYLVSRGLISGALIVAALVSFANIGAFARALVLFAGAHLAALCTRRSRLSW